MSRIDRILGVLNGVVGDYLQRTGNGLATPMQLVHDGRSLAITRQALASAYPEATSRIVILVHGLVSTERTWTMPDGTTYGSRLGRELGYTPLYVRYNTGLRISQNGEALDALLEQLVTHYPIAIDEIALIGHSMGGLVLRSACHAAAVAEERRWLPLVTRAFYLGTPHFGAPLERFGNVVSWLLETIQNPYTELIADIINLRSSGIKDLRYANLRHEDWYSHDADELLVNRRHLVPLLPHIRHHLIAGAVSRDPRVTMLFGDAIVPVRSATGRARPGDRSPPFPQEHVRVMPELTHSRLTMDGEVYDLIRTWCAETLNSPAASHGDHDPDDRKPR